MFGSNRRPVALPALGFVALLVVGWGWIENPGCIDALESLHSENTKSEEKAYEGRVTCERDCQVTFGLAPNSKTERDSSEGKENQTCDTTAELDLVQQMKMAHWAIVSAFLAMLGLFGVLFTFRESHKVGIIQSRAYVSVTGGSFRFNPADYTEIEFTITIYNSGQSPALEIEVSGFAMLTVFHPQKPETVFKHLVPTLEIFELGGKESIDKDARFTGNLRAWVENLVEYPAEFHYFGVLTYRDWYDDVHEKRFAVGGEIRDRTPDDRGNITVSLKRVHPNQYNDQFEGDEGA